jgi:hypothetical protein
MSTPPGVFSNSNDVLLTDCEFTHIEQHDVKLTGASAVFV